jgi:putative ABC transport system ATP-binding protein
MTQRDKIIEIQNLSKFVGTGDLHVEILKNINLNIYLNQITVIAGNSGAGKSTLMNIIGLLDEKSKGQYTILGKDVDSLSESSKNTLRGDIFGIIFQAYNLINYLNVQENVMLSLVKKKNMTKKEKKEVVYSSLEKVGMIERKNHFPATLSGGEQQRVAIARCLAASPKVVLADEPTGNVDAENEQIILNLFKEITKEGKAVIAVTHSDRVKAIADKLYYIKNGIVEGA